MKPAPPRPEGTPAFPGVAAGNGTTLLITARLGPGIPLRQPWLALIQDFRWNLSFCDVQLKGPFSYWRHCHSVEDATRGGRPGTIVEDAVEYALPLDPVSRPAAPLGQLAMKAMFGFRQRRAADLIPRFAATVAQRTARLGVNGAL